MSKLLGPVEIRDLAEKLGVNPTKKWGQNFLHDANTIRRIVAAAGLSSDDHVIEVGPGLGSLTLGLLDVVASVAAVEIDPRLADELPATVKSRAPEHTDKLTLLNKDALKITAEDLGKPTALVANLPYNVAVPVLLHLLELYPSLRRVLVMVQLEVAERLAASPGSKVYGVPSVKAAFYGEVRKVGNIGKHVFWPAPNIESGLVRIDVFPQRERPQNLWPLIDAAFAQRRKTLRAALSGFYGSAVMAEKALREADIEPTLRGEKLSIDDYMRLAKIDVGELHA